MEQLEFVFPSLAPFFVTSQYSPPLYPAFLLSGVYPSSTECRQTIQHNTRPDKKIQHKITQDNTRQDNTTQHNKQRRVPNPTPSSLQPRTAGYIYVGKQKNMYQGKIKDKRQDKQDETTRQQTRQRTRQNKYNKGEGGGAVGDVVYFTATLSQDNTRQHEEGGREEERNGEREEGIRPHIM
jgi:hypothetical protein